LGTTLARPRRHRIVSAIQRNRLRPMAPSTLAAAGRRRKADNPGALAVDSGPHPTGSTVTGSPAEDAPGVGIRRRPAGIARLRVPRAVRRHRRVEPRTPRM